MNLVISLIALSAGAFLFGWMIGSVATMNKYSRDHKRMCEQMDRFRSWLVKFKEEAKP